LKVVIIGAGEVGFHVARHLASENKDVVVMATCSGSGAANAFILARLCNDLIEADVHGLTPLGSTGEFAYLTWPQRRSVVEVVIAATKGRVGDAK
jgi:dihydrodipicolinate synthase/N-acetylneuraminate lyase